MDFYTYLSLLPVSLGLGAVFGVVIAWLDYKNDRKRSFGGS